MEAPFNKVRRTRVRNLQRGQRRPIVLVHSPRLIAHVAAKFSGKRFAELSDAEKGFSVEFT